MQKIFLKKVYEDLRDNFVRYTVNRICEGSFVEVFKDLRDSFVSNAVYHNQKIFLKGVFVH